MSALVCYYTYVPIPKSENPQFRMRLEGGAIKEIGIPSKNSPDFDTLSMRLYESALRMGKLLGSTPVFSSYETGIDESCAIPSVDEKEPRIPTIQGIRFEEGREPTILEENATSLIRNAPGYMVNMIGQLMLEAQMELADMKLDRLRRDLG
jgi:hypothetical protein